MGIVTKVSRKKWDLEAAAARVRLITQPYQPTLLGPTVIRKIFRKQDEALQFAKEFGHEMMVFSYESSTLGQSGQRLFLACGVQAFYHAYAQMIPSARCHYEVIPVHRRAKLYLDLEFCVQSNEGKDAPLAAANFVKAITIVVFHFYGVRLTNKEIIVLDASTPTKFSQHVIFDSPNLLFTNNLEQGQLVQLTSKALERLSLLEPNFEDCSVHEFSAPKLCAPCSEAIDQLLIRSFNAEGFDQTMAASCFVRPKSEAFPDQWISICDLGVYTRNRNFRLAGAYKLCGSGLLWPVNLDRQDCIRHAWPKWSKWAATLVTYCDPNSTVSLNRPVPDCTCIRRFVSSIPNNPTFSSSSSSSLLSSCSTVTFKLDRICTFNSLPLQLQSFIQTVIQKWRLKAAWDVPNPSSKSIEPFVIDSTIKMSFVNPHVFTIIVDKLRYCERIHREHKSNHIVLVFDLKQGCYYQKCLDPDCRLVGFRSTACPIPPDCCVSFSTPLEADIGEENMELSESSITSEDLYLCQVMNHYTQTSPP